MCQRVCIINQSYQPLTLAQQYRSLCYHRNRFKSSLSLFLSLCRSLICPASPTPEKTVTSLCLCCLTGILTMQRQGQGTGTRSADMHLQQLFSLLCCGFILCNPSVPLLSLCPSLPPVLFLSLHLFIHFISLKCADSLLLYPLRLISQSHTVSSGPAKQLDEIFV